jgi:tetratricopeptide (TPR) repeat protein
MALPLRASIRPSRGTAQQGVGIIAQAHFFLALAYEQKNMFPQSIAEFEQVRTSAPGTPFALADMAHVYAISGNKNQAVKFLDELKELTKKRYISSWYMLV